MVDNGKMAADISFMSSSDGDNSREVFEEKTLNQLLQERQKLLSLLNGDEKKPADDNNEKTVEENNLVVTQNDQEENLIVKQNDEENSLLVKQNTDDNNSVIFKDDDDSSLFSLPYPPISLRSDSDGSPTPKKCKLNNSNNSSYLQTPKFMDESPIDNNFTDFNGDFNRSFINFGDESNIMPPNNNNTTNNLTVNSNDDLWDFSTAKCDYDFDLELKQWTSNRCANARDFLRRYAAGALDGRSPLFKFKRLKDSRWKCTVFLDHVEYRTSGVKKTKDEASESAALLTLNDILRDVLYVPLSYQVRTVPETKGQSSTNTGFFALIRVKRNYSDDFCK